MNVSDGLEFMTLPQSFFRFSDDNATTAPFSPTNYFLIFWTKFLIHKWARIYHYVIANDLEWEVVHS